VKYSSPVPVNHDLTSILSGPETKVTTLSNGLRVASETVPHAQTATVGVWIDAGSRFETAANNGTAHFLEHMAFKGTKSRSRVGLEEEIENMGGHLNAYTSREHVTYYAKVLKKDVSKAVNILGDMMQNSAIKEEDVDRERGVILREMEEVEGMGDEVLFDQLHATAFQHSPLGQTILGSADNIRSITRADISDYIATHYTGPRMVLAGAGAINHDELVKYAEKEFSGLSNDPTTAAQLVEKSPAIFTGSEVRIRDDDMEKVSFAVAVQGASWTDPDSVPLMVMQNMLGTWSKALGQGKHAGSELAQRIAADNLADSYMAFNSCYRDSGLFGIYACADGKTVDDLAWAIMHEFTKLVYRVSEIDVTRAKNQLKAAFLMQHDGTSPRAEDIGRQLLVHGRRIPNAEMMARIDAVDANTIKRVADRFIYDKDLAIAALGPTQNLPDYTWFRRRTFWLRY
jgi:processing peptidase subunit beta